MDVANSNFPLPKEKYPVVFIHVDAEHTQSKATSLSNDKQEELAIILARKSSRKFKDLNIAVLCFYKEATFNIKLNLAKLTNVRISTVDSFHRKEADIVLLATIRNDVERDVEVFVTDETCVTVALSRAKKVLFVIGNAQSLDTKQGSPWTKSIEQVIIEH